MPFLHRITILFQPKVTYDTAVYNIAYLTVHKSMIVKSSCRRQSLCLRDFCSIFAHNIMEQLCNEVAFNVFQLLDLRCFKKHTIQFSMGKMSSYLLTRLMAVDGGCPREILSIFSTIVLTASIEDSFIHPAM